ncbi:MAG: HD-GYP domain-containing protein [Solirubrobacterales bacterium]
MSKAHQSDTTRIEDFGLVADRELMRRVAIALMAFGGAIEILYSLAFEAPDWTDAAGIGLVVLAAAVVIAIPWDDVSPRWFIPPILLGLVSVSVIAIGDGVAVGMPFLFLPAAVVMVFFWQDPVVKWTTMLPLVVLYVLVPAYWGSESSLTESLTTLPLLVGSSLLLGALFSRFRSATVEQARFRGTITALLTALDARDDYAAERSSAVLALVMAVAEDIGLDTKEQLHVADVALLHDIGKIGIPNEILHKPAALTDDEWAVMKRHPVIGERILAEVPGFEAVATAVRHEHERWDGAGYPDGIRGGEIPLASRIVLACDAYHAMTLERPYRAPITDTAAREQLARYAGSQFDPTVIASLLAVLEQRDRDAVTASPAAEGLEFGPGAGDDGASTGSGQASTGSGQASTGHADSADLSRDRGFGAHYGEQFAAEQSAESGRTRRPSSRRAVSH